MKQSNFTIIGAVFTAFLSTLCCLPAFLFLFFGVSSAVFSFFITLEFMRVPLALISAIFFIFSIFNFRKKILCKCDKKDILKESIFFSLFFVFLLGLLFYPEILTMFME